MSLVHRSNHSNNSNSDSSGSSSPLLGATNPATNSSSTSIAIQDYEISTSTLPLSRRISLFINRCRLQCTWWKILLCVFIGVIAFRPIYRQSLYSHGTFAPHNVLLYSKLYQGPPNGASGGPTHSYRPSSRVVVTLSTMPHQVENLVETLDSLLEQTVVPDVIYVNLPYKSKRSGKPYVLPDWLRDKYANTSINFLRTQIDYGPLTKLAPALDEENDPNTIVITVDSDKIYPSKLVQTLAWHSEQDPTTAFGVCGWGFYWVDEPMGVVPLYIPWALRGKHGRQVDVLQACCGNAYRRAFFKDLDLLKQPHDKCFTTDDIWIAGYLATQANARRVVIPGAWTYLDSLEPDTPSWKAQDSKELQLSSINSRVGADLACIKGVEEKLGPWRELRQAE